MRSSKGRRRFTNKTTVGRQRNGSSAAQALNELCRRTLALYLGTTQTKLDGRVATTQYALDVVDYGTESG